MYPMRFNNSDAVAAATTAAAAQASERELTSATCALVSIGCERLMSLMGCCVAHVNAHTCTPLLLCKVGLASRDSIDDVRANASMSAVSFGSNWSNEYGLSRWADCNFGSNSFAPDTTSTTTTITRTWVVMAKATQSIARVDSSSSRRRYYWSALKWMRITYNSIFQPCTSKFIITRILCDNSSSALVTMYLSKGYN